MLLERSLSNTIFTLCNRVQLGKIWDISGADADADADRDGDGDARISETICFHWDIWKVKYLKSTVNFFIEGKFTAIFLVIDP
jgi:hypothetical protein